MMLHIRRDNERLTNFECLRDVPQEDGLLFCDWELDSVG